MIAWVRRCNAEAAEDRYKVRESDFMQLIAEVRRTGFATTEGDMTPGLGAYATTFTPPMGQMPMVVGAGGPIAIVRRKRLTIMRALTAFKAAFEETPDVTHPETGTGR